MVLVLALLGAVSGTAGGNSPGSTDALRLTTTQPGASTGVFASEVFNARYPNGDLKPIRHSLVVFPKGTKFDVAATDTCDATDADFKAQGMSACPDSTRIGTGRTSVVTTGTPVQGGPIDLDVTIFARRDGSIMVFSENGAYLSSQLIRAQGRFQRTDTAPRCALATEQPPCQHGEFAPRSLTVTIPARSRAVNGRTHNLVTTPRRCPTSRRWRFSDKHTFADGSVDLFVNHPRCTRSRRARPHD
jgi:hypothetical protein